MDSFLQKRPDEEMQYFKEKLLPTTPVHQIGERHVANVTLMMISLAIKVYPTQTRINIKAKSNTMSYMNIFNYTVYSYQQ